MIELNITLPTVVIKILPFWNSVQGLFIDCVAIPIRVCKWTYPLRIAISTSSGLEKIIPSPSRPFASIVK